MDITKLHEKFKDHDSPSVEGQIRWLQKQGFLQNQIDQAMISVYTDVENKKVLYLNAQIAKSGWDFDQVLLKAAKKVRTEDLTAIIKNIERFEADMKYKWEKEQKGLLRRIFT